MKAAGTCLCGDADAGEFLRNRADAVVACSPAASHFLLNFHRALTYVDSVSEPAQQAGAALHVIANFDCYFHTVAEHHVNAGAELDQPNALAALHEVTDLRRENN